MLQSYHGRGVGRALTNTIAQRLLGAGYSSMLVWVLANNPSRGFYEALGGHYLGEKAVEFSKQSFAVVAYGWHDMSLLAND